MSWTAPTSMPRSTSTVPTPRPARIVASWSVRSPPGTGGFSPICRARAPPPYGGAVARDIVDDRLLGALHLRSMRRSGLRHDPTVEHVAFQAGTLDALMAGGYDGDATIGDLLAHGDLGIGT